MTRVVRCHSHCGVWTAHTAQGGGGFSGTIFALFVFYPFSEIRVSVWPPGPASGPRRARAVP